MSAAPRRSSLPPLYFLIPATAVAAAMLLPAAYLALRTAEAGEAVWHLLLRERTWRVLLNTVALAAAVSGAAVLLGVPLAWLTTRTDLPGRRFWAVVSVLPLAIPTLVGAFAFVSAWAQGGLVHQLLRHVADVPRMPDLYGFPGAWLVLTLLTYPYVVLSVRGALLGMDPSQEEAARSLGHGTWSVLWRVTLPQLRPAIASGALLVALYTLSDFSAVALLQFESFTQAIYVQYQATFNRSYAAVLSLMLVGLTAGILALQALARGRGRYYRLSAGVARRPAVIPLGRWRWPAVLFCGLVGFVAVVVPAGVNVYWVVRGLVTGVGVPLDWQALWNSVYASLLAAAAAVLCGLPVAYVAVRWPGPLASFIERASYVGYALPGIVVALSLVFFGANYARPLYQTLVLLVFAYVVLFLPQALGAIRASLLQVSPNVENAARSLGLPPWRVAWTVTLPLVRPGIVAGATLVFLTAMKELPATLLLSPLGFRTLTTRIWSAVSEAYYIQAAAPSVLLILASSVSVGLLLASEQRRERGQDQR